MKTGLFKDFGRRLFRAAAIVGISGIFFTGSVRADSVFGIYITGWVAGSAKVDAYMKKAQGTRINAMVIHIKDEWGNVFIPTTHPLFTGTGSLKRAIKDLPGLVRKAREHNIYLIGKIDCFKNKKLAEKRPKLAVMSKKTGEIWRDKRNMAWVDPFSEEVGSANISLAMELAKAGFDEVQFDYVRFPDGGVLSDCRYPHNRNGRTRSQGIEAFLQRAVDSLSSYPIKTSADLFGITPWKDVSRVLGQNLERVGEIVDYVYPMIYPSHFPPQWYKKEGIQYSDPYKVIFQSCEKGIAKLAGKKASLRPWLQGFDYKVRNFGPDYIVTQIRACDDAGVKGWCIWNARCDYGDTWKAMEILKE